jgi:hypothetical protein
MGSKKAAAQSMTAASSWQHCGEGQTLWGNWKWFLEEQDWSNSCVCVCVCVCVCTRVPTKTKANLSPVKELKQ